MPHIDDLRDLSVDSKCWSRAEYGCFGPDHWQLTVSTVDDTDDSGNARLLWMDGWTFPLGTGLDLADELDAQDADTAVFVPLVDGDDLADEVEVEGMGNRLVLINRVVLDPAWRGRGGIGRYLTGMAIRRLDHDAACVALHASPFELRDRYADRKVPETAWEAGAVALGMLWQTLGFRHHSGHLYVLDPHSSALDHAIAEFRGRIMD